MIEPYQIVLDIWQGNPQIEPEVLKQYGVKGLVVRLNSMSGGHHIDALFSSNWKIAQQFPVQAVYFVYNPWVSGKANFDWLTSHLPTDYGSRCVFADIEVRYTDSPPITPISYAREVSSFLQLVRADREVTIYSGGGYLNILSPWPIGYDYWWACYPKILDNCESWEKYHQILRALSFSENTDISPGNVRMWQCSGDHVDNLPGFGGRAVDVSVFPGTEEELIKWFGTEKEMNTMDWKNNAIGFYTNTNEGPAWDNPEFDFVVGFAGGNWTRRSDGELVLEPNPKLASIETEARKRGKTFIALWDFDVDYYTRNQIGPHDELWPIESNDYPLKALISALGNRDVDGLIIRVMNRKNYDNKNEMMTYLAFAAGKFIDRANKWLNVTKGTDKWTFVLTEDGFLRTKDSPTDPGAQENFYKWLQNWYIGIEQEAVRPLESGAYPQSTDAIKAIPPSKGWKFWRFYKSAGLNMFLFNGDAKQMNEFLGVTKPSTPPPGTSNPPTDLTEVLKQIDELKTRVVQLETKLMSVRAALLD